MDALLRARRLFDLGRYADALEDLQRGFSRRDRIDGEILRAELLDQLGRVGDASAPVERPFSKGRPRCCSALSATIAGAGKRRTRSRAGLLVATETSRIGCGSRG